MIPAEGKPSTVVNVAPSFVAYLRRSTQTGHGGNRHTYELVPPHDTCAHNPSNPVGGFSVRTLGVRGRSVKSAPGVPNGAASFQ